MPEKVLTREELLTRIEALEKVLTSVERTLNSVQFFLKEDDPWLQVVKNDRATIKRHLQK